MDVWYYGGMVWWTNGIMDEWPMDRCKMDEWYDGWMVWWMMMNEWLER